MGYTRKWTPPTIPLRDDLAAWKTLFTDVHDSLILAGLQQTATPGQLVINDVAVLPADKTYAGFREYSLNDGLQEEAPVLIQLYFGCGNEGLYDPSGGNRSRTPRIRVQIYFRDQLLTTYGCPQTADYTLNGGVQLTHTGISYICHNKERGFLGVAYGVGSRNRPMNHPNGGYYGSTLTLFIQRTTNEYGTPTNAGLAVYHPDLTYNSTANLWANGVLPVSKSIYTSGDIAVIRQDMAPRVGRDGLAGGINAILFEPIYYPSSPATPFPYIYSYRANTMNSSEEFEMDAVAGPNLKFISIGNETGISVDSIDGQRAGIAMLFE